jgi:uncharacterized membrane protein
MDATYEGGRIATSAGPGPSSTLETGHLQRTTQPQGEVQVTGDRALGWFSIVLGTGQLLAPGLLGRAIGAGDGPWSKLAMRAVGLRELAAGLGLLRRTRSTPWLWSRAAGDLMDLGLLGAAYASTTRRRDRRRLQGAMLAVAGVGAIDLLTSRRAGVAESQGRIGGATGPTEVEIGASVTVARPPAEVYAFWRDLRNLGRLMTSVESVEVVDQARSRWAVKIGGKVATWEARIISDRPNESIVWETLEGSTLAHKGEVRFKPAPGDRGTEIRLEVQLHPPGRAAGRALARLGKGIPRQRLVNDLRRLKQVLEVGETIKSDASIHAGPHAAHPPETFEREDDQGLDQDVLSYVVEGDRR